MPPVNYFESVAVTKKQHGKQRKTNTVRKATKGAKISLCKLSYMLLN